MNKLIGLGVGAVVVIAVVVVATFIQNQNDRAIERQKHYPENIFHLCKTKGEILTDVFVQCMKEHGLGPTGGSLP